MEVTDIRIYPFDVGRRDQSIIAYAEVVIDHVLVIRGIRIIQSKSGGFFLGMPSVRTKTGEYRDIIMFKDRNVELHFREKVLESYRNAESNGNNQANKEEY